MRLPIEGCIPTKSTCQDDHRYDRILQVYAAFGINTYPDLTPIA